MSKPTHQFPCDYMIKIIARPADQFPAEVIELISSHTTIVKHKLSNSKNGNFQSLSVLMHLDSEKVLADIYSEIKTKSYIEMVI